MPEKSQKPFAFHLDYPKRQKRSSDFIPRALLNLRVFLEINVLLSLAENVLLHFGFRMD